jgi:hypothetical protein
VDHRDAVAGEALHDEAFAAEECDADFFLEGDADLRAHGGAEEGVLLADEFTAELVEVHRDDLAGVRRGEGDDLAAGAGGGEGGDEQRLAGEGALAGGHDLAEEALVLLRRVAEDRLHLDPGGHVHHAAGFGDDGLVGVEGNFDVLHLGAEDLVVDLVGARAGAGEAEP